MTEKKIYNFTKCPLAVINNKWKAYPKLGQRIPVQNAHVTEEMEILEIGKGYLTCDNDSGIEITVKLSVDNDVLRWVTI